MTSLPQDAAGRPTPGGHLSAAARPSPPRARAAPPAPAAQPPAGAGLDVPGGAASGEGRSHPLGDQPRTWTLALPPGMKTLSLNVELHWAEKRARARELKKAAWALARHAKIPPLGRAAITVTYCPPDRRRRDSDNIGPPTGKHCIDGIVAAGVLEDDAPQFVEGPFYAIGEVVKGGQIVLTVTEVSRLTRAREARGGGQT